MDELEIQYLLYCTVYRTYDAGAGNGSEVANDKYPTPEE